MPQLHMYLPESLATAIKLRAKTEGKTVSKLLAELVSREMGEGWPPGFFEAVVGGWEGEPLERAPQGENEERDEL